MAFKKVTGVTGSDGFVRNPYERIEYIKSYTNPPQPTTPTTITLEKSSAALPALPKNNAFFNQKNAFLRLVIQTLSKRRTWKSENDGMWRFLDKRPIDCLSIGYVNFEAVANTLEE